MCTVKRVVTQYCITVHMEMLYTILCITSPYALLYACYTLLINVIHVTALSAQGELLSPSLHPPSLLLTIHSLLSSRPLPFPLHLLPLLLTSLSPPSLLFPSSNTLFGSVLNLHTTATITFVTISLDKVSNTCYRGGRGQIMMCGDSSML